MNLLVKKFGPLAVILLSALIAISCEDPGRIGLIVNADNGVVSTHYQDIVLPSSMVQFDPRKTSESRSIQFGQYINPDFGTVTSKSYTHLSLNFVITPANDAQFVSFEVEMSFASLIGDDPVNNVFQTIDIYQLAEEIDSTFDYTRVDELTLESVPLGQWKFAPRLDDELKTDSSYIVPLDPTVGLDLFLKLKNGSDIYDSDAAFNAYFKGVAFVPGGINNDIFQAEPNRIIFRINYNEFNSDGTPIDRNYTMVLGDKGFYHLDSDKTGTVLSGISPDNSDYFPADGYRYLQFGTLMALRVDLTPFYALSDTLENMIVNKAELYIGEVKEYPGLFEPPESLQVYFTDETNEWPVVDDIGRFDTTLIGANFVMLQNEMSLIPIPPGAYFAPLSTEYEDNKYRVNIGVFFQNLFAGNFHSVSEPFLEEKGQIFVFGKSSVSTPQSSVSHLLSTAMAVHEDSIRLRIYYTIPIEQTNN